MDCVTNSSFLRGKKQSNYPCLHFCTDIYFRKVRTQKECLGRLGSLTLNPLLSLLNFSGLKLLSSYVMLSSTFFILVFLCWSICFDGETNIFHLKTAMSSAASFISHVDPWPVLPSLTVGNEKQFNQPFRDTVYLLDWSTTSFPIPCCTVYILAFNRLTKLAFLNFISFMKLPKEIFC